MKIKTSELTGAALDWAVQWAKNPTGPTGEGWYERDANGKLFDPLNEYTISPTTDWTQGGPIIEREWIDLHCVNDSLWEAECPAACGLAMQNGPDPLTAAMRCYVYSKLGDTVEIPDEFC